MKNIKYTAKILENGVLCGYLQKLWVVIIELTDIGLCDTAKLRILGIGYNDSVFVFVFMHSNSPLTAKGKQTNPQNFQKFTGAFGV